MKKITVFCLTAIILLNLAVPSVAADKAQGAALRFDENGKFKICVISDPQDGHPTHEAMIRFINEMLDETQPDIVVFLGDNVTKDSENLDSYTELLTPVTSRNIPFTFVFGNHDDECCEWSKEEILGVYQSYNGCLAYDADSSLHGCATHNLPVYSSDGSKIAFNLWLLDSGDYVFNEDGSEKCYDCVRADQLEWYKNTSKQLEAASGGLVPSIAFQHIITEEVVQKIFLPSVFNIGNKVGYAFDDGKNYTMLPNLANFDGILMEMSCPSIENDGEWNTFKERGDVLAVVTGHDHKSNFIADVDGIDSVQTSAATYNSYGETYLRSARLITIDENNPWEYETESEYIFDYALKNGSQIPGLDGYSRTDYVSAKITNNFLTGFMKILNVVFYAMKIFSV